MDHFVNFAKNDNLGQVSTWLLAHGDKYGADCAACNKLAKLHSTAVDFPKTGRPAVIEDSEMKDLIPKDYPHWLQKQQSPSYPSTTVLGQMFDLVQAHPAAQELMGEGWGGGGIGGGIGGGGGGGGTRDGRGRCGDIQPMHKAPEQLLSPLLQMLEVPGV